MTQLPVYIVGYGNVGWALHQLLTQQGFEPVVVSNSQLNNDSFISVAEFYEKPLPASSLIFLTVPDAHIQKVSERIKVQKVHIVHCSGATDLNSIEGSSKGVWYPLNTFTKGTEPNWDQTLIGIESNNNQLESLLISLTQMLGLEYSILSSEKRLKVHLAAVFASNFSMASVVMAQQLLKEQNMPEYALNQLVRNGMNKLSSMSAFSALTGPAKRKDHDTINQHLLLLAQRPEFKDVYEAVTAFILQYKP